MVRRAHRRPVPAAALGRAAGRPGPRRRYVWLLTDQATWRDLLWVTVDGCMGWLLALLPAGLLVLGVLAVIAPYTSLQVRVLAIAGGALGFWAAPWLLRGYGLLARSLLAPTRQAELAQRVRHLAQTRADALDTGAAESAGSSGTCTTARRPGWSRWA